jgi:hypothetical protein
MGNIRRILFVLLVAPIVIVFAGVIAVFVSSFLDSRAGKAFEKIQMNAPESTVISLMGTPDNEKACGENLWWGGDYDYRGKNDGRCVREVRYEYFLSAWGVGYSADRHVVSKYHYFSE